MAACVPPAEATDWTLALLLADSRFPAGGHAHSGGIEQAVDEGVVTDLATLEEFLAGLLGTVGRLDAHGAAAACRLAETAPPDDPSGVGLRAALERHLDARMPSPAARRASRLQGAAFAAASRRALGQKAGSPTEPAPHLAVAIGEAAAGTIGARAAAAIAAYHCIAGAGSAGLRLLGLDPIGVAAALARLAAACDRLAAAAAASAEAGDPLPARSAPVLDVLHELHAARKERLFAS